MSHLSTDRLAALGDEQPTPAESAHLAACADCAREHAAYRTLVAMAHAEGDAIGLPLTRWDAIAEALAAGAAPAAPIATRPTLVVERSVASPGARRFSGLPLRAAAGLLLVAGGMVAGRATTGAGPLPVATLRGDATASAAGESLSVRASNASSVAADSLFGSVEDARDAQLRSEAIYQQAAAYLAQHDTAGIRNGSPEAYRTQLAALDQVSETMLEALRHAPHDPVINSYYLTTLGQREATLRQLNTALPASLRAKSF